MTKLTEEQITWAAQHHWYIGRKPLNTTLFGSLVDDGQPEGEYPQGDCIMVRNTDGSTGVWTEDFDALQRWAATIGPLKEYPVMHTYTVTAGNKFFWQTLVVNAASRVAAITAFDAFLALPDNLAGEEEEFAMAKQLDGDPSRDDYRYRFDLADVTECYHFPRWTGTPSDEVQVIASGGNG